MVLRRGSLRCVVIQDPLQIKHADALWEIALRSLHHCLQYEAWDAEISWN